MIAVIQRLLLFSFFFNDTATPEIYTLSLHDALPISAVRAEREGAQRRQCDRGAADLQLSTSRRGLERGRGRHAGERSEEHTSELQSRLHLVCRLLLEKKKKKTTIRKTDIK